MAIALPGWFDPFGLRVISGMDADGCWLPATLAVFNGFELRIGFRGFSSFGKIFFGGFTGFRWGPMGGENA